LGEIAGDRCDEKAKARRVENVEGGQKKLSTNVIPSNPIPLYGLYKILSDGMNHAVYIVEV
jgi:hypothetical protein